MVSWIYLPEIVLEACYFDFSNTRLKALMTCPVCNAQNSAMSARCLGCGTILIPEAVPRSKAMQRTVDSLDTRLCTGYGGLAGFVIGFASWFLFSQDEEAVKGWLTVSVAIGAVLGRIVAWRGRNVL